MHIFTFPQYFGIGNRYTLAHNQVQLSLHRIPTTGQPSKTPPLPLLPSPLSLPPTPINILKHPFSLRKAPPLPRTGQGHTSTSSSNSLFVLASHFISLFLPLSPFPPPPLSPIFHPLSLPPSSPTSAMTTRKRSEWVVFQIA